jgi:diguanylate cyclase (GGDEF)-like protein
MDTYPFLVAKATLLLLAVFLFIELVARRRAVSRDAAQNRAKQQQLAAYSAELKDLQKELARKTEVAVALPQITKKMTEKLPADAYPSIAVRSIKEFFHADKVGYFSPVEESPDYTLVIGAGFPPDWTGKVRIHAGDGMLGLALRKKMVITRTDPDSIRLNSSRRSLEGLGIKPDFVAPVFGFSGTAGVIVVTGCPFPLDQERAYISMLSDQLSTMLQNTALLDSTRNGTWVDHLTGVANRLYFLQRFEGEIRRTKNYEAALALLMFDIDEFKKVNDTYGHHAGDLVIRKMAEVVRKNIRRSDLVARFGGDEFVVLITSTTQEQALSFAEKLRERIASTGMAIHGAEAPLRITISGGLAMFPLHGQSTTELFRAADDALYESKRHGRNRIRVAPSVPVAGLGGRGTEPEKGSRKPEEVPKEAESGIADLPLGEFDGILGE